METDFIIKTAYPVCFLLTVTSSINLRAWSVKLIHSTLLVELNNIPGSITELENSSSNTDRGLKLTFTFQEGEAAMVITLLCWQLGCKEGEMIYSYFLIL